MSYDHRTAAEKVWIYDPEKKTFKELLQNDPRIDWEGKGAPPGRVRVYSRAGSKQWVYCPFGDTKQDAADAANIFVMQHIKELQEKIDELKQQLVKP